MKRTSTNRSLNLRNSILWLICILFLLSSGGFFASLESSGVNVGSRVHASAPAWDTQSVLGAGESGCTNADFTPAGTSPEVIGGILIDSAVGDFNGDGKPDLAVANTTTNTVAILLGDGTGNFNQPGTSPESVGEVPFSVAVGDFNLDGKPDLATANAGEFNNVTILLGDGTGNFTQPMTSPEVVGVGIQPVSVAVGDFNLDGKPDLATANQSSNNVTILLGDGAATLRQPPRPKAWARIRSRWRWATSTSMASPTWRRRTLSPTM
jgi:hypothetical protein